ncbi:DNA repair protein RadC [Paenibacillus sp. ACRRX]|uniref:RadC family protein n=1 Tax=unclassified Paenibacillus TaxID=185978 RepID=UPI001EF54EA3|nr:MULTISPECIES: DNA repair protein RadC [unclassified Paenibacillus]MCG7410202.1 DNA repair protein RadC [Paenibacillus sp. ACRRX]MDK8183785.1 DNA repair protein RadC [Paenibacillus sp. UMB4589-SE434]
MAHSPLLRDLPLEERPRERMMKAGAEALSHAELLAILLRTGTKNESAVLVAQRVMNRIGSLSRLADLSLIELTQIRGIGTAKALELQACLELGRRMARSRMLETASIRRPQDAAELVMESMRHLKREHFVCIYLNTKNRVLAQETISVGTLDASLVHPREVFRSAIRHGAAALICIHNHPSGDPTPSREDIEITRRLIEAGELVGIEVLDHLIIGDNQYVSLKEQSLV